MREQWKSVRGKETKQRCNLSPGSTENSCSLIPQWAVWVMLQNHFFWLGVRVGLCFCIPTTVSYWLMVNWSGFGFPDTLVALHRWAKWLQQPEDIPLRKSFSCWSGGSDGKEYIYSLCILYAFSYKCNVGDSGSIPAQEDFLGKEMAMATHSSILAYRIPWTKALVHGVAELNTTEHWKQNHPESRRGVKGPYWIWVEHSVQSNGCFEIKTNLAKLKKN